MVAYCRGRHYAFADEAVRGIGYLLVVVVEPEATRSYLMVQCSRHVIPPAVQVDLPAARDHPHPPDPIAIAPH